MLLLKHNSKNTDFFLVIFTCIKYMMNHGNYDCEKSNASNGKNSKINDMNFSLYKL